MKTTDKKQTLLDLAKAYTNLAKNNTNRAKENTDLAKRYTDWAKESTDLAKKYTDLANKSGNNKMKKQMRFRVQMVYNQRGQKGLDSSTGIVHAIIAETITLKEAKLIYNKQRGGMEVEPQLIDIETGEVKEGPITKTRCAIGAAYLRVYRCDLLSKSSTKL